MVSTRRFLKKLWKFVRAHYTPVLVLAIIGFVGTVSLFRTMNREQDYVYVRIKLSQGLWWAATQRPAMWYAHAIKKGLKDTTDTASNAEIINVRYYPFWNSDTYDVFVIAKLAVSKNEKTGKYIFDREPVTTASPIELFFPSVHISGTVLEFSENPIVDTTVEKTVTIIKQLAYPSEYQSIVIGDSYFDGEEKVLEVISKKSEDVNAISVDTQQRSVAASERRMRIELQVRIKLYEKDGHYLFGQEHIVKLGKNLNISTPSFVFEEYKVVRIE